MTQQDDIWQLRLRVKSLRPCTRNSESPTHFITAFSSWVLFVCQHNFAVTWAFLICMYKVTYNHAYVPVILAHFLFIDWFHNSCRFAYLLIFLEQLHDGGQRSCVKIHLDDYKTSIVEHCNVARVMWSWEMAAKIRAWVYYAFRFRASASRSMRQLCMTLTITFASGLTLTRDATLATSTTIHYSIYGT